MYQTDFFLQSWIQIRIKVLSWILKKVTKSKQKMKTRTKQARTLSPMLVIFNISPFIKKKKKKIGIQMIKPQKKYLGYSQATKFNFLTPAIFLCLGNMNMNILYHMVGLTWFLYCVCLPCYGTYFYFILIPTYEYQHW